MSNYYYHYSVSFFLIYFFNFYLEYFLNSIFFYDFHQDMMLKFCSQNTKFMWTILILYSLRSSLLGKVFGDKTWRYQKCECWLSNEKSFIKHDCLHGVSKRLKRWSFDLALGPKGRGLCLVIVGSCNLNAQRKANLHWSCYFFSLRSLSNVLNISLSNLLILLFILHVSYFFIRYIMSFFLASTITCKVKSF